MGSGVCSALQLSEVGHSRGVGGVGVVAPHCLWVSGRLGVTSSFYGAIPGATRVWGAPSPCHTRMGYVGGLKPLELFILLKPCYKQRPWDFSLLVHVLQAAQA